MDSRQISAIAHGDHPIAAQLGDDSVRRLLDRPGEFEDGQQPPCRATDVLGWPSASAAGAAKGDPRVSG